MSPAVERLRKIVAETGMTVTLDLDRDINKPCFNCGVTSVPRSLVEVGRWSRPVGQRGDAGHAILRPLCSTCASVAPAKTAVTTWRYHLPNENGEGWAIAFLDSIGCFSVLSDYGDYGYRWPESGWSNPQERDFRQFFLGTNDHYVLAKVARSDMYDGDATLASVKSSILNCRRYGSWSRDHARNEWNLLSEYSGLESREDFAMWYQHTTIDCAYTKAVYTFHPQAIGFQEYILPRLRAVIRAQLILEGRPC